MADNQNSLERMKETKDFQKYLDNPELIKEDFMKPITHQPHNIMFEEAGTGKVYETTLENNSIAWSYSRRMGNSTRLIDNAIQIIFNGRVCVVLDHHDNGKWRQSNELLFNNILKRMKLEHNLDWLIEHNRIRIDKSKLEIELIN